jgi:eukaryotic-like serine/threonine-protein kinase
MDHVLAALAAAHATGLVHRDVKPENVLVTPDGRVKVADFGLARAASALTSTSGVLMGTAAYMAPELIADGVADARCDVYAVGVMIFEMITGRQPFAGDVPVRVAYRHVHEDVPPPSSLVPRLPEPLDVLVTTATARDPDRRPADATALLALERSARSRVPPAALAIRPRLPRPGGGPYPTGKVTPTQMLATDVGDGLTRPLPRPVVRPPDGSPPRARRHVDDEIDELAAEIDDLAGWSRRRRRRGVAALLAVVGGAAALAAWAWSAASGGSFTA